jgi:hypothetical protein
MRLSFARLLPVTLFIALLFFVVQAEWEVVAAIVGGIGIILWQPQANRD